MSNTTACSMGCKRSARQEATDHRKSSLLVDIYTAVIRLADHYEIDLAEAIAKTRRLEDTC